MNDKKKVIQNLKESITLLEEGKDDETYMTPAEFAKYVRMDVRNIRQYIKQGIIPCISSPNSKEKYIRVTIPVKRAEEALLKNNIFSTAKFKSK